MNKNEPTLQNLSPGLGEGGIHIDIIYMMFLLVEGPFKLSSTSAASVQMTESQNVTTTL